MDEAKLIITGPVETKVSPLKPKGTTLGRGASCDIMLNDEGVSRLHARIFQDPFGRWIIEDLESETGVFLEGKRIKAHVISPWHEIVISNLTLYLKETSDQDASSGTSMRSATAVVDEEANEDIVSYKTEQAPVLSPALMQQLNEFTAGLLDLSSPSELYMHACQRLAEILNTLVAIVRLPSKPLPLPESPDVLACHFESRESSADVLEATTLHFSRRVLDAIRSDDTPVMASSFPDGQDGMMLTVIDTKKPHLVYSARVNDLGDAIDALYVDILEMRSVKEMYYFIEAAAREINFVQKNLFFVELQKQEKALREANTQLKEKDRIKDEYVFRVTHDIKGHLAAIQSCLYVAGSKSSGELNDRQAEFMGRADNRTTQLTRFIKDLLNLTRMRLSGQVEMDTFSLADSISGALETVAPKAEDKSISLTSNVDPAVGQMTGDEFSINEMITNLLFNAIKYTPEGNSVHLEATKHDGRVQLDFVDTGIGIPESELENVFDEFFRATNAKKTEKDGTGLGLSLVKQIIERHGGEISVKSVEGRGSTFTVILPENG
jgi:signal transduction histidine kinase